MSRQGATMRITQIMLGKGFGGAERSFVDTALAMAARGHDVQAICHKNFSKKHLLDGVANLTVETVSAKGEWDFITPRRIAGFIKRFGSEVVHTQLKRAAWHGGRGAAMAGVPAVSKLHNYVKLERYKYIHTLIGTTPDQERHALTNGWPSERVTVIPNFSRVIPASEARAPSGRPVRLLTYGRYVHKKGFDVLLRAFRQLVDSGVDARLVIGGQGDELASLTALCSELDLDDRVELGVWIEDVSVTLDESDLFVLPSRDEPFGIVMLEAMARGLPIVSTKTQGPSQVLDDSNAYLVEIGSEDALFEAMRQAIAEPEKAKAKASNALALYCSDYFEGAVVPRFEALYRDVIAQSKSSL